MPFLARARRPKRFQKALSLIALGVVAALIFTILRARRLLSNTRQIAAQSARFSRDYQLGSGPKITYLAMGDSTAAGWGAGDVASTYSHQIAGAIAAWGFRVHVVNVAVGSATAAQVRREQSAFLASVRPDLVTLSVGANDATHGTTSADFEREMRLLQADLQASSAKSVLVANVPDMFLSPALPYPLAIISGKRARNLNAILETMPRGSKLQIVDLYQRGKLDYRRDPGLYAADLFHPSPRGYAVWAHLFEQKLDLSDFASNQSPPR